MFAYLRYFAIISFFVVIAASVLIGVYFRSIATRDLMSVSERSSISLAQSYINTTWQKHLPNIRRLAAIDASLWGKYREFRDFSEDTFRQFEGVPVTGINLYTPLGARVLTVSQDAEIESTADSAIKQLPSEDSTRKGFEAALNGNIYSTVIENRTFKSRTGEETQGTVVQTFVPIMPDSFVPVLAGAPAPKVEGVLEIFYDITPQWSQLYLFQVLGSGGIMLIFIVLIGALFFTSKKAESIISTQHEANIELAAAAAKAEAESRQKSQFLANVSHELRTPLNAIIGFSEIIKNEVMGALGNEQYMAYIRDIHSSGVHLLSLINDILDFSKAEAGKLDLQLSELDATKLIKNCMRLVSPRAEEAGVTLTTEIPKEHFIITGDAKKLKQVLLNLLSNSVKFTPQGGEVRITAWQNIMDDSIAIEVKDSGIGIAPKDISRAMSPFGQVDSALSRKYEGTGLGLPLTKKFVEIMGGTFKIESELNVGTTITITVPLTPPKHVLATATQIDAEEDGAPREKQISPGLMAPPRNDFPVAAGTPTPPVSKPIVAGLQPKTPLFAHPATETATPASLDGLAPQTAIMTDAPLQTAQPAADESQAPAGEAQTAYHSPATPQSSTALFARPQTPLPSSGQEPAAPTVTAAEPEQQVPQTPPRQSATFVSHATPSVLTVDNVSQQPFSPPPATATTDDAPPPAEEASTPDTAIANAPAIAPQPEEVLSATSHQAPEITEGHEPEAPQSDAHQADAASAGQSAGGLKFASYEEWKKMHQDVPGNDSSGEDI